MCDLKSLPAFRPVFKRKGKMSNKTIIKIVQISKRIFSNFIVNNSKLPLPLTCYCCWLNLTTIERLKFQFFFQMNNLTKLCRLVGYEQVHSGAYCLMIYIIQLLSYCALTLTWLHYKSVLHHPFLLLSIVKLCLCLFNHMQFDS